MWSVFTRHLPTCASYGIRFKIGLNPASVHAAESGFHELQLIIIFATVHYVSGKSTHGGPSTEIFSAGITHQNILVFETCFALIVCLH